MFPFSKTSKHSLELISVLISISLTELEFAFEAKIISKTKIKMSSKQPKFVIILGNFYSQESAKLLIKRVKTESLSLRNKKISIDKKNKHNFEVFLGPYKTIKMIKNDYIALKQINFDEADIKIYE